MTTAVSPIVDRVARLDQPSRRRLLARLSPNAIRSLRDLAPVPESRLAQARDETADPLAWARRHLPELAGLAPGPHHETIAGLLGNAPQGVRAVIGAPRGSGKSTTALSLLPIVAAIRQSHRFIIIIRDNLPDAITSVAGLRRTLEAHPELIARYPWIRPLPGPAGVLELAGGGGIMARSTGSAIRGLNRTLVDGRVIRPDLVIADDLEDEDSARSTLQVGRLREWILSAVGQLGGPPGATDDGGPLDLIVIGTTLERDALVSLMLDGIDAFASWRRFRFPAEATIVATAEADETTIPGDHAGDPLVAVDDEGAYVPIPVPDGADAGDRVALWREGMPLAYLDRLTDPTDELFGGSILYAREYLLRPSARSDVLFSPRFTVWTQGLAERWLSGDLELEHAVTAVDPAISKSEAADYSALVVVGLWRPFGSRPDGTPWPRRLVVPYAERRRCAPTELLDWVEETHTLWTPDGRVTFEAEGAFAWAADELRRRRSVAVRPVTSGGADKRTRAVPLSVWHEAGRLELDQGLRGSDLDRELHGFTGTGSEEHDDMIDSLVYGGAFVTNMWRRSD